MFLCWFFLVGLSLLVDCSGPVPTLFVRRTRDGAVVDRWSQHFFVKDLPFEADGLRKGSVLEASFEVAGKVVVTWNGVGAPTTSEDWIGFFCPLNASHTEYFDWIAARDMSPHTYHLGSGKTVLPATDLRTECEFRYFKQSATSHQLVARSKPLTLRTTATPSTPIHAHLSLTADPAEMRLEWVSKQVSKETPEVRYGTNPHSLNMLAKGSTTTYKASDMCGPPANTTGFIDPGMLHNVVMSALQPSTLYFYTFGQGDLSNSTIRSFRSAPVAGPDYSFRFLVYADMGLDGGDAAAATAAAALQAVLHPDHPAELVVHAGDISYARGAAYIWDQWFALIEPYASRVPYMVGIGNHEYDHTGTGGTDPSGGSPGSSNGWHPEWGNYGDDSNGECGVPMAKRFTMPATSASNGVFWYSFQYGSVHIAMISTEHSLETGSAQYRWLEQDLANVDRARTPWLIVMGHRPMYNSEKYPGDFKVSQNMQKQYEPLLLKYNVNAAFFGHYHSYERTCPLSHGNCTSFGQGPVHITIGSAGASLDTAGLYGFEWSQFFDDDFGIGSVEVVNRSALRFDYLRNRDQSVVDSVWVYQTKEEAAVSTRSGCVCQQPWRSLIPGASDPSALYGCYNPTGNSSGNWCLVDSAVTPSQTGCSPIPGTGPDGADGADGGAGWDWCDTPPVKTKNNCTCKTPFLYNSLKYYQCTTAGTSTSDSFEWCYVGEEGCGTQGGGGWWDKC